MNSFTLSFLRLTTLAALAANASTQVRPTPANDDRLQRDPVYQTWRTSVSASSIATMTSGLNLRLTDIEVTDASNPADLRFGVTFVRNVREYHKRWRFVYDLSQNSLQQLCDTDGYRIADVERYAAGGAWKFAAILEDNRGVNEKTWRWVVGYSMADLRTVWQASNLRIVDLDRLPTLVGSQFVAVMIENSGRDLLPWSMATDLTAAEVRDFLAARDHRVYDIESAPNGHFDLISVQHPTLTVFVADVTAARAEDVRQYGNYRVIDLEEHASGNVSVVMVQNSGYFESFGTSCDSGLAHTASGNPAPGQSIQFRSGIPSGNVGWPVLLVGVQKTTLDLGVIGAPGCRLLVNPMVSVPMPATSSGASVGLTLPNLLSLIGTSFHTQVLIPQPGANALGLRTSKGLTTTLGPVN